MKKTTVKISAFLLLLCLAASAMTSCLYVDDKRDQTAHWTKDHNAVEYDGGIKVRLTNNTAGNLFYLRSFRTKFHDEEFYGLVTEKDVPLLLADMYGRRFDYSADGDVLVVGDTIYVAEKKLEIYENELKESSRTELCCVNFSGNKREPVILSKEMRQALERAVKIESDLDSPAINYQSILTIYSCTDKALIGTDHCYLLYTYNGEYIVTYANNGPWQDCYKLSDVDGQLFRDYFDDVELWYSFD